MQGLQSISPYYRETLRKSVAIFSHHGKVDVDEVRVWSANTSNCDEIVKEVEAFAGASINVLNDACAGKELTGIIAIGLKSGGEPVALRVDLLGSSGLIGSYLQPETLERHLQAFHPFVRAYQETIAKPMAVAPMPAHLPAQQPEARLSL